MVRDGWIMVGPIAGVTVLFLILAQVAPNVIWTPLSVVTSVLGLMIGFFFRDPSRTVPDGDGLIISAADGKVVKIEEVEDESFMDGRALQISVFLSVLNVHVNRMPVTGTVRSRKHIKGGYHLAYKDKASQSNEQLVLVIESDTGKIVVKQIVGFIARRIVCYVHEGDAVQAGQKYGLIRFGSRVDVIMPPDTSITTKIGDHVRGGETVLGVLK